MSASQSEPCSMPQTANPFRVNNGKDRGGNETVKPLQCNSPWFTSFRAQALTVWPFEPKMQKGSPKPGQGITVKRSISTQPQLKTSFNRQDCGSCSSIASCPVFLAWQSDPEEDPFPHCSPSLSSPTLQGSLSNLHGPGPILSQKESAVSLKNSVSSLENSLHHLKGSLSNLKKYPSSSSALKSLKHSLSSVAPSSHSSSISLRSSSSSVQSRSSNEDDSWDTNSWSSGATCLLRSSIKQHSEEVFRVRASSGSRPKSASDSEADHQNLDRQRSERKSESQKPSEKRSMERKINEESQNSSHFSTAVSAHFEEKIEAKLKFSQFLNEVTCRVLDPESLQAFSKTHQKEASVPILPSSLANVFHSSPLSSQQSRLNSSSHVDLNGDPPPSCWEPKKSNTVPPVTQWKKCVPSCKGVDTAETPRKTNKETLFMDQQRKNDKSVEREDELKSTEARNRRKECQEEQERERRTLLVCPSLSQTNLVGRKEPKVNSIKEESIKRTAYCSSFLPVNSNLVSTI